ncbi:MAG: hypothetical protein ACLQLC_09100 [Candidatus Sulfotelmatobacter sp.]
MRDRETIVNVLLGILLISVFFVPLLLILLIGGFVLQACDHGLQHLWPGLVHSQLPFFGLISVSALICGIRELRRGRWQQGFLFLVALPTIASMYFADVHVGFSLRVDWAFPVLVVILPFWLLEKSIPIRFQFFAEAAIMSAVIVINTGLLGSGITARLAAEGVILATLVLIILSLRGFPSSLRESGTQISSSSAHA